MAVASKGSLAAIDRCRVAATTEGSILRRLGEDLEVQYQLGRCHKQTSPFYYKLETSVVMCHGADHGLRLGFVCVLVRQLVAALPEEV